MSATEHEDINRMIVEYLKSNGMSKVADTLVNEINSIFAPNYRQVRFKEVQSLY
jgi:hypothetical protein